MITQAEDSAEITVTLAAAKKIAELIDDEENTALKLRVYITGGGCSGFQYGFAFDDKMTDEDVCIEQSGISVLIDVMSYQYLVGAEIDYSEGIQGAQFIVRNPNAQTTCGCGASFSIGDD